MVTNKKIFLASSQELEDDRRAFEIYVGRENKQWVSQGVFLELVLWEDFLDAMSRTRLQDQYKRAIRDCDLFVMLVANKVGRYTAEEFATAFGHFQATNRPFLFTYFKEQTGKPAEIPPEDQRSVREFREKLDQLGHFPTPYSNTDALLRHFDGQLDKLAAAGFVELRREAPVSAAVSAQKVKVGKRGVSIVGDNPGKISTGDTYHYDQRRIYQVAAQAGASAAELRRGYLDWLSRRANELPLLAADSGRPVQLASVYTALLTRHARDEVHGGRGQAHQRPSAFGERDRQAAPRQSALEALDEERLLVLMGGPGSGKTTFLNFVALCMAGELLGGQPTSLPLLCQPLPVDDSDQARAAASKEKTPEPQRWRHGALLPVRVLLRDFAASLPPPGTSLADGALWTFIVGQLPAPLARYPDELQRELLTAGGLILLDGLDEVPDALRRREQVKQAVQDFAAIHPRCRFLVTSRTYAYQRQDWKLDGFAERELLPFTRGQIERFIDSWYAHLANDLCRLTGSDASGRAALLKRATQRPELRELAERPLLLTLMARLQSKGGGSLPENREELYAQSVDMLLDEWEGLKLRRDADGQPIVSEPSLGEWLKARRESIREQLDQLAYQAHRQQPQLTGTADIRQSALIDALYAASSDPDVRLKRLEEYPCATAPGCSPRTAKGSTSSRTVRSRNTSPPATSPVSTTPIR
ncbi:NACHT domain-containing protein [Candidatus Accumulibacter vicinus]|uniref:Putative NTPase (NACHT family) n=1 Tax=Candidatus Accumulibacter vicinus TaxID=2954382 RepID=A0A084XVG0_9PROT|nr:NACHT domain-containing protein [Candidatus Accumulibacter vicinus]KFB66454.1 MAG: putative NTPase (NACHT family) [Candidatus Accumulibacter vicinus]